MQKFILPLAAVVLVGCGDTATPPTSPETPTATTVALVSGDLQEGKAGELLPEPLTVRVTDAQGSAVQGVDVTWRVVSGAGSFWRAGATPLNGPTRTDSDGRALVLFKPSVLGTSRVSAEVAGLANSPVTFTVDATVLLIVVHNDWEGSWFELPQGSNSVTVPVGAIVEWTVGWQTSRSRVVSTAEPPGGEPFDSGELLPLDTFRFVLAVAGTWEFQDHFSPESTGTLTAE